MAAARDHDIRQVMDAIRRIVQVLRESSRAAEKAVGISGAQLFVLQQLAGGPATIGELADRTATHQSSVSVVVQRLVDQGLVTRGEDAGDRRRRLVQLTRRGRSRLAQAPSVPQQRLIDALAALPAGERRRLVQALTRVTAMLSGRGSKSPPPMFFEDARPRKK